MAKKISRRKMLKNLLTQMERIDEKLKETDPTLTYTERRKVKDKNGNEIDKEVTVCPYNDLLEQQATLICAYNDLKSNEISATDVAKLLTNIGMFGVGLVFETNHCFTFETVKNFLRKPK